MKKIAFVCDFWNNAGTETAAINWLNLLSTKYDVTLYLIEDKIDVEKRLNENIKIKKNVFLSNYLMRTMFYVHRFTINIPLNKTIRKKIWKSVFKDGEYNAIIHFSDSSATYFKYLKHFKHTKLISWNHFNYGENVQFSHGTLNQLREKYFNGYVGSDEVICVSNAAEKSFNNFFKKYNANFSTTTIYTPQDFELIRTKADEFDVSEINSQRFNVLNLARINQWQKGQLRFLDVISKLNEKFDNIDYFFIGDSEDEELEKFNKKRDLLKLDNVYYLGKKDNPYPYIKKSDLFILPSIFEGFGLVLQEALILNKPVVTTNTSSREVLNNGLFGEICENNTQGIYDTLDKIFSDHDELVKLKNKAKSYHFDNKSLLDKFDEILNRSKNG